VIVALSIIVIIVAVLATVVVATAFVLAWHIFPDLIRELRR